jgi:hypothetical protein
MPRRKSQRLRDWSQLPEHRQRQIQDEVSEEVFLRRVAPERFIGNRIRQLHDGLFREVMRSAKGGDLEPLHKWMRSLMPMEWADAIHDFQQRRLRHQLDRTISAEREVEDELISDVRHHLNLRRQSVGRLEDGALWSEMDAAKERHGQRDEWRRFDPVRINDQRIFNAVKRGPRAKRPR